MTSVTASSAPSVLDPALAAAAASGPVDAIVFFQAPKAAAGAASKFAAIDQMTLGTDRKVAAYSAIHELGTATLEANRSLLDGLVAAGRATGIDELWSLGAVRVRGASLETIKSLVGPGVQRIIQDQLIPGPSLPVGPVDAADGAAGVTIPDDFDRTTGAAASRNADDTIYEDWGVKRMQAPAAWAQGITGAGITIGSLDTGVFTSHKALSRNYRGTQADGTQTHDYNWKDVVKELPASGTLPDGSPFDPAADGAKNGSSKRPLDLNGHGTHTTGSAVGWSPTHLTGTAPDAKFIAARGLGEKGGSMFDLVSAMEWFMAPTKVDGSAPRPDLAPDIVTNSWGGAAVGNPFLWMALRNWQRAGIIPVFASGNNREAKPGEVAVPGMYPEAITVGASDLDDKRAWFSMYGPSDFSNDHKPEVTAPGHWTYSTLPDGTVRDTFPVNGKEYPASGTSMATPHVAGAVALYLQAHPGAKYNEVLNAFKTTSTQASKPDEEQGYGRVQIEKLITPGSIAANAKLTDPARVQELMDQVAKAQVFKEGERKPGIPHVTDGTTPALDAAVAATLVAA